MCFQYSFDESSVLTVYQHLLRLHQSDDLDSKRDSLNGLPESFRQPLFESIAEQAGRPSDLDYAKAHVFDSLPALQQAIQRVAVSSIQSMSLEQKNRIVESISENMGYKADIEECPAGVMLKIMHDSLGDLTPELQSSLDEWIAQAEPGEDRAKAGNQIVVFLKDRGQTKLKLNNLNLKSIPEILGTKPFILRLQSLYLSSNSLNSFPLEICQLQNLRWLNLEKNQLASLSDQIGQLQNLENLVLSDNQLTSLPNSIGQLQNLKSLDLSGNQIASFPEQICQILSLGFLDFSNNPIISLPDAIGQLHRLVTLSLDSTQLTSLPETISQLRNLRYLFPINTPSLQGLPNQVLDLSPICLVEITGSGLSENVRANLQQACNISDYRGPRISFSMEHMEQHHDGELKKLPNLIAELFSILEEEPKEFSELYFLDKPQIKSIRSWLSRLSDTADYKRKGEFQKAFVKQIVGYLQQANDDPQFRQVFLNIILDATETCGDRISLSILHLGIASRLRSITDIRELRKFLISTVWPVHMLEEIARKKTEALRFFDEIEVYLGYPIMLREKLGLELAVQDMLYFRCSALNQSDLDQAAQFVMQQQSDEHAVCAYLASREDWINALKAQYPERCAKIDEENYQELEAAGEDQDKLNQLEVHQKQRWEALTAWVLVAMNPQWSHNNNP